MLTSSIDPYDFDRSPHNNFWYASRILHETVDSLPNDDSLPGYNAFLSRLRTELPSDIMPIIGGYIKAPSSFLPSQLGSKYEINEISRLQCKKDMKAYWIGVVVLGVGVGVASGLAAFTISPLLAIATLAVASVAATTLGYFMIRKQSELNKFSKIDLPALLDLKMDLEYLKYNIRKYYVTKNEEVFDVCDRILIDIKNLHGSRPRYGLHKPMDVRLPRWGGIIPYTKHGTTNCGMESRFFIFHTFKANGVTNPEVIRKNLIETPIRDLGNLSQYVDCELAAVQTRQV